MHITNIKNRFLLFLSIVCLTSFSITNGFTQNNLSSLNLKGKVKRLKQSVYDVKIINGQITKESQRKNYPDWFIDKPENTLFNENGFIIEKYYFLDTSIIEKFFYNHKNA